MKLCIAKALLAASMWSACAVHAQTVPATAPGNEPRWQAMIQRLASADFAAREAAQKELDQTTWRDRNALRQLIQSAADEEAKARLASRLAAIDELCAVDPPPISITVQNATLTQVAESLNKAMGVRFKIWPEGEEFRRGITYTLSATDRPFWEVFSDLSRQHGIRLQNFGADLQLQQGDPGLNYPVTSGPVAVFVSSVVRDTQINYQQLPEKQLQPERMNLNGELFIDPRIKVLQYTNPAFSEIVDDNGAILFKQEKQDEHLWDANGRNVFSFNVPLKILEKKSARIASIRGRIRFIAQIAQQQIEIAQADKKVGQTFEIGEKKIILKRCDIKENSFDLGFEIPVPNLAVRILGAGQPNTPAQGVGVTMVDAAGTMVWRGMITGNNGIGGGGNRYQLPLKMVLSVATKFKDFNVPFEIKDLILP